MERQNRAHDARHRAMFEHALDGMLLTAPSGRIFAANEAVCRMLGRSEEEICTVGRAGVIDESDPRLGPALEERRRTGLLRAELTALRKDGSRFPVEVSSAVYLDAEGRERTSMVIRDLTAQKRAEHRLQLIADAGVVLGSTLDYQATIADLTRVIVPSMADFCVVDLMEDGVLRRVAASHRDPGRAAPLLSVSPGPIVNRATGVYAVARTGVPELVPEIDDDWLRSTTRDEAHLEVARLLGPRSAVIVPIRGRAGLLGVLTIATLDPHRRYDASDLAAAQAVADRAALAIDNARLHAQVLQAKKLRDEFLAIVSHDLRNPLNAILLHARVMARSGEATEATQSIIRAAKHAESLIADLLSVAALEAGSMPLPAGGRVRVEARRAHDDIVFTVADDGPGIPPESIRHVFDRFWQGAHARKAGAGLGLAIAKGIVEEHGGTISVESAPGGGATFTVTLPGSARS